MPAKVITIDKGTSLEVRVHDRSYGGGTQTLLRLDEASLDLVALGDLLVRGVPIHAGTHDGEGAPATVSLTSDRADSVAGPGESWLREWGTSFDDLPDLIRCYLGGMVQGPGTYRLRIGGTSGEPDGVLRATLVVPGAGGFPYTADGVFSPAFTKPAGPVLVKITGESPATSSIRSTTLLFEAAP